MPANGDRVYCHHVAESHQSFIFAFCLNALVGWLDGWLLAALPGIINKLPAIPSHKPFDRQIDRRTPLSIDRTLVRSFVSRLLGKRPVLSQQTIKNKTERPPKDKKKLNNNHSNEIIIIFFSLIFIAQENKQIKKRILLLWFSLNDKLGVSIDFLFTSCTSHTTQC